MSFGPFVLGGGASSSGSEKIIGSGAPTSATVGEVGQDYFDSASGTTYTCVAVSGNTYTWAPSGATKASMITVGEGQEATTLDAALDAVQDAVEAATPKSGSAAPTEDTVGAVGQTYTDTSTSPCTVWTCVAVTESGGVKKYTWEATGGAGAGGSTLTLERIYIDTPPTKTAYKAGETFNPAGMVVKADYSLDGVTTVTGNVETEYEYPTAALAAGTASVTITLTKGGVTKTATQAVSVTKTSVTVPTLSGSYTYNGNTQTFQFNNEPAGSIATKSGDTSGMNAGSYTTRFTLVDTGLYVWADGSAAAYKDIPVTIGQKAPAISASPASLTLNASTLSATSSITTDSDGALTVETSDSSVVTGSISNKVLTARHVNKTSGSATLTVRQAATTNYKAASVQIPVTAKFTTIYGVTWDGTATQSLTRTDAAAGFSDPVPYVAGASAYGSPFDDLSPWKDIVRVTDAEAGEMVKIPKFYYKLTQSGSTISVQIADSAADGFSVCPACMDRGDGKGERDYVLVGRYHCANGTYKSTSGVKPQVSLQQSTFRTNIHNLGSNVYMMDFATRFTIWLLYIVEFANWDSQKTIGKGCGNNSAVENMGYTDSMPYHTGTTLSSRDTYGVSTQYRYMEGLWDNCYDRLTGCYNASTGLMVEVNPANFAENSGGVSVGTPASGWIAGLTVSTSGPFPCFINSSTSGGGENAYVGDHWYFSAGYPVVCVGGSYGQGGSLGMFCVDYASLTGASDSRGSRVLKLP